MQTRVGVYVALSLDGSAVHGKVDHSFWRATDPAGHQGADGVTHV